MQLISPSSHLFNALLSGDIPELLKASLDDLRPFLPSLARMVQVPPAPISVGGGPPGQEAHGPVEERRKVIQTLIIGIGEVNAIRNYLQLNFQVSIIPDVEYARTRCPDKLNFGWAFLKFS